MSRNPKATDTEIADFVRAFIAEQEINCAETVHQTDAVIISAYEFIEGLCDLSGYHKMSEEDDE